MIRSNERLTLEASALESLYGGISRFPGGYRSVCALRNPPNAQYVQVFDVLFALQDCGDLLVPPKDKPGYGTI